MYLKIIALPLVLVISCNNTFPRKCYETILSNTGRDYAHARDIIPRLNRQIYSAPRWQTRRSRYKSEGIKAFRVAEN